MISEKEKITIVCYGQTEEWNSREKAMQYYLEGMFSSEGSEHERYARIYEQLATGLNFCTDED